MTQMNLSMKQKQIHWHRQQTCGCQGGSWGWGGWRVSLGFRSVAQSCLTLRNRMLQHARLPCPSPTPRACSNSCPLSLWCHTTISSSVIPFSSCLHSFPASGSFPMSQFFASGGQRIGVSASASVLPVNILPLQLYASHNSILKKRDITLPTEVCKSRIWFFR